MQDQSSDVSNLVDKFKINLDKRGLSLLGCLQLFWYNQQTVNLGAGIQEQGTAEEAALCLLVISTKDSWKPFLRDCVKNNPQIKSEGESGPFDLWAMKNVEESLQLAAYQGKFRIFYPHKQYVLQDGVGNKKFGYIAFQKMAEVTGTTITDESCHLSLHQKYGAWFGIRAVVILDDIKYHLPAPPPMKNPLHHNIRRALQEEFQILSSNPGQTHKGIQNEWKQWVALRDLSCPDHPCRYSEQQIQYHYTANVQQLQAVVKEYSTRQRRRKRIGAIASFLCASLILYKFVVN